MPNKNMQTNFGSTAKNILGHKSLFIVSIVLHLMSMITSYCTPTYI